MSTILESRAKRITELTAAIARRDTLNAKDRAEIERLQTAPVNGRESQWSPTERAKILLEMNDIISQGGTKKHGKMMVPAISQQKAVNTIIARHVGAEPKYLDLGVNMVAEWKRDAEKKAAASAKAPSAPVAPLPSHANAPGVYSQIVDGGPIVPPTA